MSFSGMDADSHVHIDKRHLTDKSNGFNHVSAHFYGVDCVVRKVLRHSTDTIIAITKNFDSHALVNGRNFIKPSKQLVEHKNQVLRIVFWCEVCETTDIRKKNTETSYSPIKKLLKPDILVFPDINLME